jgi:hypothetical protein
LARICEAVEEIAFSLDPQNATAIADRKKIADKRAAWAAFWDRYLMPLKVNLRKKARLVFEAAKPDKLERLAITAACDKELQKVLRHSRMWVNQDDAFPTNDDVETLAKALEGFDPLTYDGASLGPISSERFLAVQKRAKEARWRQLLVTGAIATPFYATPWAASHSPTRRLTAAPCASSSTPSAPSTRSTAASAGTSARTLGRANFATSAAASARRAS